VFRTSFALCSIFLTVAASACRVTTHDDIDSAARGAADEPAVLGIARSGIGQQWIYVDSLISLGDEVHVKQELRTSDEVRLLMDNMGRGIGERVSIDVTRIGTYQLQANASVAWQRDYGPPFDGQWADVHGEVWVNSPDFSSPRLVVHFELQGTLDGKQHSIHGEVTL
jgi:hypothetical protein